MNLKVNWCGRFEKYEGYGYYNHKLLEAVASLSDVEVTPIHLRQIMEWEHSHFRMAGYDLGKPLILIHPPDKRLVSFMPGRTWCLTMYEGTVLPENWVDNINKYCERLIVPSVFCSQLFRDSGVTTPIHVIPGGIDPKLKIVNQKQDRPYTFMALVDRGNRKGWDIVWRAFYDVFGKSTDVRLILKMRHASEEVLNNHMVESGTDSRLSIFKYDLDDVSDLFGLADCFVFPSRGEGYGLPPREAAACGLPVIATRWSGLNDQLDEWALPVEVKRLTESLLPAGGLWADPSYENVCEHMLWCYENQDAAREKGNEAAKWLREHETWDISAARLHALMKEHMVS